MGNKPINIEDFNTVVPWKVYEKTVVLNEVRERRKDIIIIILIALLALTNAYWVYEWNKYDVVVDDYSVDVDADDGGNVNYIGNDGDINNGTSESTQADSNTP